MIHEREQETCVLTFKSTHTVHNVKKICWLLEIKFVTTVKTRCYQKQYVYRVSTAQTANMQLSPAFFCTRWLQNTIWSVSGEKNTFGHSAVMREHSQHIVAVHMCDGTNRIGGRREILFWQRFEYPFIIQLALCSSFGGQKQPTVEAKLLPGISGVMLILKSFHKSLFLDHSLAAAQLFRKCIVPFPVWQSQWLKLGFRLAVGKVASWNGFSLAAVKE